MKIIITGGTGIVGSHLVNALHLLEHEVIVIKRENSKPRIPLNKEPKWIIGNLGDNTIGKLPKCDIIIHLASSGVKSSNRKWNECIKTNIGGTYQLLHLLDKMSNKPLLVYPKTFYEESLNKFPKLGQNPYIATKSASTKIVKLWATYNIDARVIFGTIFQAYGAGDDPGNVLTYTANCLRNGVTAQLGSGNGLRDWIYIDDLVDAFTRALKVNGNRIQYFDFGTGKLTSIREVVLKLADLMDCSNDLLSFDSKRDRHDTELTSRAKKFLPAWKPRLSLEEGIIKYVNRL